MLNYNVASLSEYLEKVSSIQNSLETFIYRGQSDASWKVVSGVYRRIEESKKKARFPQAIVEHKEVLEYLKEKLAEARKRLTPFQISDIQEINDINILVEMQHYGGATNLIDFSYNSLMALYIASADNQDVDGRVFCVNNSNPYKVLATNKKCLDELFPVPDGKFYSYSPNHSNRRIIKQDSIFLFNDIGHISEPLIDFSFTISASSKEKIIQELKDLMGITEESIYPDFLGYLQANNSRKPFKIKNAQDYFEQAVRLHKRREYQQAIHYYEKSLGLDPRQSKAYLGIAQCLRPLERYDEALVKGHKALELDEKDFMICNEVALIYTYLHDYNEAKTAFRAAELLICNEHQRRIFKNNQGWMYLCFQELATAKGILKDLIDDDKPYHQALNLGHCHLLERNEDAAIDCYKIAFMNATTEDIFWKSFDSDYSAVQMERLGISKQAYGDFKVKLKSRLVA